MSRRIWLLNLEAEQELLHGPGFVPSSQMLSRAARFMPSAMRLLAAGDSVISRGEDVPQMELGDPSRWNSARCWSPTPSALQHLKRLGLPRPQAPPLAVLQRVNHRRFCLAMGGGAPEAHYVETTAEALELTRRTAHQTWLCKRPYGTAGRDQRRLDAGQDDVATQQWLRASLRRGGTLAEHWVRIVDEYCLHGILSPGGELTLGSICRQTVSPQRAWAATYALPSTKLGASEQQALRSSAERVAIGLHDRGYFGPFGIDAYTYLQHDGTLAFNALSEINARYSMGFATGFEQIPEWRELPGA